MIHFHRIFRRAAVHFFVTHLIHVSILHQNNRRVNVFSFFFRGIFYDIKNFRERRLIERPEIGAKRGPPSFYRFFRCKKVTSSRAELSQPGFDDLGDSSAKTANCSSASRICAKSTAATRWLQCKIPRRSAAQRRSAKTRNPQNDRLHKSCAFHIYEAWGTAGWFTERDAPKNANANKKAERKIEPELGAKTRQARIKKSRYLMSHNISFTTQRR